MGAIAALCLACLAGLKTTARAAPVREAGKGYVAVDKQVNEDFLRKLKVVGIETVIRYYDWPDETLPGKTLTARKLTVTAKAGMKIQIAGAPGRHFRDSQITWSLNHGASAIGRPTHAPLRPARRPVGQDQGFPARPRGPCRRYGSRQSPVRRRGHLSLSHGDPEARSTRALRTLEDCPQTVPAMVRMFSCGFSKLRPAMPTRSS